MGAAASSKGMAILRDAQRREFREINKTDDIEGAQAGSLKKAPQTKRCYDPLNPKYDLPGAKELTDT